MKILLSKLTYEMCCYHRISLRNKAKKEVWARGWAEGGKKTFGKGRGYQGALIK